MSEMIPYLPAEEMKKFYQYLDNSKIYFEFGSGGSTYQAFKRKNIQKIYTVESDARWINKLYENGIPRKNDKLIIFYVDTKVGENKFSFPGKTSTYTDWIKYSRAFGNMDSSIKKEVDFILIDGRFRVACALNLFSEISDSTIVAYDDFYNRDYYHIVLDYFDVIESVGRMAFFKKKNVNPPSVELIFKYENDVR